MDGWVNELLNAPLVLKQTDQSYMRKPKHMNHIKSLLFISMVTRMERTLIEGRVRMQWSDNDITMSTSEKNLPSSALITVILTITIYDT